MKRAHVWKMLGLIIALTALAGCHEYRVAVVIDSDGIGTRTVDFFPELDEELLELDMHQIFRVPEDEGWRRAVDEDGRVSFRRVICATSPAEWAGLGDDIRIFSRYDSGDKRKASSGLRNFVSLETGRTEEGRTYTYREHLSWEGLKRDLINLMTVLYAERAKEIQPDLTEVFVAELRGLFRGHLSQTWERIYLIEDEDAFIEALSLALIPDVTELVTRSRADVDPDLLVALAASVIADDDSQVETIIERDMMGVAHAFIATLHLRVSMPGEILECNGTIEDDGVVSWKIGLLDPLEQNVELLVRSLVRD